jgi:hypothetical protein
MDLYNRNIPEGVEGQGGSFRWKAVFLGYPWCRVYGMKHATMFFGKSQIVVKFVRLISIRNNEQNQS